MIAFIYLLTETYNCVLFLFTCMCECCPPSQENVMLGAYSPVELSVKTKGQEINCRTYIMNSCVYAPPSPQYLQVSQHLLVDKLKSQCFFCGRDH